MINRALVSAVIILAALVILLAAALVKAIADKRIWKETAAQCDKETTEALAKCERLDKELDKVIKDRETLAGEKRNALRALDISYDRIDMLKKKTVEYVFSDWEFIKPAAGCRDYYIENEGFRVIIEDGKATSGWYSKKFIKEGDIEPPKGTCELASIPPMTNYRYIKLMSIEDLAEFLDNFDEEIAETCKYCSLNLGDGSCGPAPEGEDKNAYCNAATLKWLMDIRASEEKSEENTEESIST